MREKRERKKKKKPPQASRHAPQRNATSQKSTPAPDPIRSSTQPYLSQPFPFTPLPPPPPLLTLPPLLILTTALNLSQSTPHRLSHPTPPSFLNLSSPSLNNTSCPISGHSHSSGCRNPHTTHTCGGNCVGMSSVLVAVAVAVDLIPALAAIAAIIPPPAAAAPAAVGGIAGVCLGRWLGMAGARIGGDAVASLVLLLRR